MCECVCVHVRHSKKQRRIDFDSKEEEIVGADVQRERLHFRKRRNKRQDSETAVVDREVCVCVQSCSKNN